MQVSRRTLLGTGAKGAIAFVATGTIAGSLMAEDHGPKKKESGGGEAHPIAQVSPGEALALLKAGNLAFVSGKPPRHPLDQMRRHELAGGQHPFATIICCSDSRVGPEQVFNTGLGQLFVIRNAGSTAANSQAMGSIEYAAEHLAVPLVVVLGHSSCGAVTAAAEVAQKHVKLPGSLGGMVEPILPAVETASHRSGNLIANAVEENVLNIVHDLRAPRQAILSPLLRQGKMKVVGAVYNLDTGVANFIDEG